MGDNTSSELGRRQMLAAINQERKLIREGNPDATAKELIENAGKHAAIAKRNPSNFRGFFAAARAHACIQLAGDRHQDDNAKSFER